MSKKSIYILIGLLFLVLSIISVISLGHHIIARNRRLLFKPNYLETTISDTQHYPDRITINSIDLDLPITPINLTDENWDYSDDSILFVDQSGDLDLTGNKILYGHNYPNLLKNLNKINKDDKIELFSTNSKYEYTVTSVTTITPDQTHILSDTIDDRITLFTCTGFLDSKRLVVTAIRSGD